MTGNWHYLNFLRNLQINISEEGAAVMKSVHVWTLNVSLLAYLNFFGRLVMLFSFTTKLQKLQTILFFYFQKKGRKGQNIWKFWQKCTKFDNILIKGRWLRATIARNKLLEEALQYYAKRLKQKYLRMDQVRFP